MMPDIQLWILVLMFAKGELVLPTQPVAYITLAGCERDAAQATALVQGRITAECTPLLVVPR